jgi:hypothetical protein
VPVLCCGDEDGISDRLREAQFHIESLAMTVCGQAFHADGNRPEITINLSNWANPLKSVLEAAVTGLLG